MKKTLFKVIVYIFCVFSIVELFAEEEMANDLEKKNFFKIERLEAEIIVLKDQYKLLTEQERLNIENKSESEETPDLHKVITELAAGVNSSINTKFNSLNKDILLLKTQYKLLAENKSQSEEGLDIEMAFFKLNAKVKSLNDEILALKDQYELLTEEQRLNTQKINELFKIIELNNTKKQKTEEIIKTDKEKSAFKLFADGKSQFALGDYEKAIELFLGYLENFQNSSNIEDSKLWLGRAYFASESYLKSKTAYLDFQSNDDQDHPKYADSMYELSRVLIKLNEINEAKLLLSNMIEEYPEHTLTNKATQLLQDL